MRTRTLKEGLVKGLHHWLDDPDGDLDRTSSEYSFRVTTTDVVDNYGGENPLTIIKTIPCGGVVNGVAMGGSFYEWPLRGDVPGDHHGLDLSPTLFISRVLALTSPERPSFSASVAIAELRDVPRLFKLICRDFSYLRRALKRRDILRIAADHNLAYEFGLKPLLADIRNFFDLPFQVTKRIDEFRACNSAGGLSRTVHLYDVKDEFDMGRRDLHSTLGLWISARRTDTVTGQIWGNAKWFAKPELAQALSREDDRVVSLMARQSLTGTRWRDQPYNLYQGLPWTWLIDWYTRFSDYLQISGNSLTHAADSCCIMSHFTTTRTYSDFSKPDTITIDDPGTMYETKKRSVHSTSEFYAAVPLLSLRHLGILTSILEKVRRIGQ